MIELAWVDIKKKNKNTSAIDDLLDELSDDEDEEKKDSADTDVCHGNRSPAALFVDGIHKGGASKYINYQDILSVTCVLTLQ